MLKSKNKFSEIILVFLDTDNGKLISCFPTFKEIQGSCFMFQFEINAPKQYTCFFETIFLEAKKTGKLFFNRDSG
jgi:hypothetical protein